MPNQTVLLHDTWLAIIEQDAPYLVNIFNRLYDDGGMTMVCKIFDDTADAIIRNAHQTPTGHTICVALTGLDIAAKLQILRFGKRYTPLEYTDEEMKQITSEFLTQNTHIKWFDRKGLPSWLERDLKWISSQIWDKRIRRRALRYPEDVWHILPSGVTAEGLSNPFEKILYFEGAREDTDPYRYPVDLSSSPITYSKVKAVPKNYKTPRIICEEPLLRQLAQTGIADIFLRQLNQSKKGIFHPYGRVTLDDQERNRQLALRASHDRSLATIDLKRASDSINYSVLTAVIPGDMVNDVVRNLCTEVELPDGRHRPLYIACTMGARVTVPLQSYLYWCIVCLAAHYCVIFGNGDYTMLNDCSVYNDDIIVPDIWFETVVDLLTLCGFTVNVEKSFSGDIPYRESCGIEGYNGVDISSIYWPRRDLHMTNGDIPSLVKLANRLYDRGYYSARSIVVNALDQLCPELPRIEVGSDEFGIWDFSLSTHYTSALGAAVVEIYSCSTYHNPQLEKKFFDVFEIDPPFYTENAVELTLTYNNRKLNSPELFSGTTRQLMPMLLERFEYDWWLTHGSSYYDDLCKFLHVTEPSRLAHRLVPDAYKCKKTRFTVFDDIIS
jgi:hypothetical protein